MVSNKASPLLSIARIGQEWGYGFVIRGTEVDRGWVCDVPAHLNEMGYEILKWIRSNQTKPPLLDVPIELMPHLSSNNTIMSYFYPTTLT